MVKLFRALLSALGTLYDTLIPPRIEDHCRAQVSCGDGPGAVSARTPLTAAPAPGHPDGPRPNPVRVTNDRVAAAIAEAQRTSAVETPAAVDDPGASSPLPPGSPPQVFTLIRGAAGVEIGAEDDEFDWQIWVVPAISDALADHVATKFWPDSGIDDVLCAHADGSPCGAFEDMQEWRDHIAPLIAARQHAAALVEARRRVSSGPFIHRGPTPRK